MDERTRWADGQRVRQRRQEQGWSQRELASRAQVSKRTIENIENNRHPVLLHSIRAVADALGVALQTLVAADTPPVPPHDVLSSTTSPLETAAEVPCLQCQTFNRVARQFCAACGHELWRLCPLCGFRNIPTERFCGGCGQDMTVVQPVTARMRAGAPLAYTPSHLAAKMLGSQPSLGSERKLVTVLAAEVQGLPALLQAADPEEEDEILSRGFALLVAAVHQVEGVVTQITSDGLLALFGVPLAHEDHVLRALHVALEMQRAFAPFAANLQGSRGVHLALRLGVHTGLVIVGALQPDLRLNTVAPTSTLQLARGLQAWAQEGIIAVSEAVQQQGTGFFRFTDRGSQALPGQTEPVRVYLCEGVGKATSRLEVTLTRGRSAFHGRDQEMTLLNACWSRVCRGEGQVVCLLGEAGVGKSRLASEFQQGLDKVQRLTAQAYAYGQATPYHAIVPLLRSLLGVVDGETPAQQRQQIHTRLAAIDPALAVDTLVLAHLLAVPLETERLPTLAPTVQRRRLQYACLQVVLQQAVETSLCLVLEDCHWLDQSSQELLNTLVAVLARRPILFLCTTRPGFRHTWADQTFFHQIAVEPLAAASTDALIHDLLQPHEVSASLRTLIRIRTGGNPLFVEELLRTMQAHGLLTLHEGRYVAQIDTPKALPTSIQGIVQARLDRLPQETKRLLQVAAVIGTNVSFPLLQALKILPEEGLYRGLTDLLAAEFLYETRILPAPAYTFKHEVLQEAVYHSLVTRARQQLHQQIAQTLEIRFPESVETSPEVLAQHYTAAGLNAQAMSYWQQAGQRALERSAYAEAISHLTKGLEGLTTLPETPERLQRELMLRTALGPALMGVKGQTAPEVAQTYARAYEVCRQLGETPQLFPVLLGLWRFYGARAEFHTARELAEQLVRIAEQTQDPAFRLEAHMASGNTLFFHGAFAAARKHLEQGMALYDAQQHRDHITFYVRDPGVVCYSIAALTLWKLGYPDQALQRSHDALTLAQELAHPLSLAFALYQAGLLHQFRREAAIAYERADAAVTLATEQELGPWMLGQATILRGWSLALQGQHETGMAQIQQGMAALRTIEAEMPWPLCQLADAYRSQGRAYEGLRVLADGELGGPVGLPSVYWLRGELLLLQDRPDEEQAEACFYKALDIFRQQGAKSDELQVTISLCRLWHKQGKRKAARKLLAESYDWFSEGFDTPDLREVQTLLEALT